MNSSRLHSLASRPSASLSNSPELFTPESVEQHLPGSMNDEHVIRGLVSDAIRNCGKKREVIAEEMSLLLGVTVTRRALDSYTSEASDQNRFPAQYTRAFCQATGDWRLVHCVTERAGYTVITKAEAKLYELGRQYLAQKRAAAAIVKLERELAEVEL